MKCDQCDNEATVHEVTVRNGVKVEKHLCEQCAQAAGIGIQAHAPLAELMSKFVVSKTPGVVPGATVRAQACPSCKMTFAEFRQHGLLGCAECYRAFEPQLGPLIERAHEGGARHVGKTPRRAGAVAEPPAPALGAEAQRLALIKQLVARQQMLKSELDAAVKAEQYEKAAAIRDELRRLLQQSAGQQPGKGPE